VFVLGAFTDASGFGGVTCEPATVGYDVFSEATARDPHVQALVCITSFEPAVRESAGRPTSEFPGSALASTVPARPARLTCSRDVEAGGRGDLLEADRA
jgi:hypothetical protein